MATTQTARKCGLYMLSEGKRPGPIKVESNGAAIVCEGWKMPVSEFGFFVAGITATLGIGKLELADGAVVNGFIVKASAFPRRVKSRNTADGGHGCRLEWSDSRLSPTRISG